MKTKIKSLFIGCFFFIMSFANAEDAHSLYLKIKSKYPSLVACAVPKELENKEIKGKLKASKVTASSPNDKIVMDGCSIVVYESKEKDIFYVGISGGIAGHISRLFGPFRVDGGDL